MLQTLLWSRMTCSSTFLKYPLAVLAQTPAAYILMYCNAFSTTFTAVRCFQLRKIELRLDATSYQSSDRPVQHVCLWLQNEHGRRFCEEFAPHPGGTNDHDDDACEPNNITVQIKLSQKYCLWLNLQLWNFCHSFLFLIIMFCSTIHVSWQIGSQTWASLSFVPPGWGANSSQNRRPCSFSGHKQRCWTVLSELWYVVASNLNTFFLSWKQQTAVKVVENELVSQPSR